MKKLVFYGDGLLCSPNGYGEELADLLVLAHPAAAFQSFHPGEERLFLGEALKSAPLHVIGKAPDLVYLALGNADFLENASPEPALAEMKSLIELLALKTRAKIRFASVCTALLPDVKREAARAFNAGLPALGDGIRLAYVDLDSAVNRFLEAHRSGGGEKRALHRGPLQLTSMGRVFFSHAAFEKLPWKELFPESTL